MGDDLYRNLFSRLTEPIIVVSSDGTIVDANESFDVFLGYEDKGVVGMSVTSLFTGESVDLLRKILRDGAVSWERTEELTLRRHDETSISRSVKVLAVENSKKEKVFCFLIPIGIDKCPWLGDIFDISGLEENMPEELFNEVLLALKPGPIPRPGRKAGASGALVHAPLPSDFIKPSVPGVGEDGRYIDGLRGQSPLTYSSEGIISTDPQGIITEVNNAFLFMIGYDDAPNAFKEPAPPVTSSTPLPALEPARVPVGREMPEGDPGSGALDDGLAAKVDALAAIVDELAAKKDGMPMGGEITSPGEQPPSTGPDSKDTASGADAGASGDSAIKGRPLRDFFSPGHKEDLERIISGLKGPHSVVSIRTELVHRDNSVIPVKLDASTMGEERDSLDGFLMVVQKVETRDLGAPPPVMAQLPPMAPHPVILEVANLVKEGVVITDIEGRITGINTAMEEIIGKVSENLQDQSILAVFSEDDKQRVESVINGIRTSGGAEGQRFHLLHESGSSLEAVLKGSLIEDPDGSQVGMMLWIVVEPPESAT